MAKKAEAKAKQAKEKERVASLKKINEIVTRQTQISEKEKRTEKEIQARARKLTQEVMNNKQLNPYEKMETMSQVRD